MSSLVQLGRERTEKGPDIKVVVSICRREHKRILYTVKEYHFFPVALLGTKFSYLCTCDLYSPVHNVLDACISIMRAPNGTRLLA
jgi:hypothetical protein